MLNLWIHARIEMRENLDKGSSANLCKFEHQDFVTTIRGQQLSNAKCISHHQDFKSLVDGKTENTCTVIFFVQWRIYDTEQDEQIGMGAQIG